MGVAGAAMPERAGIVGADVLRKHFNPSPERPWAKIAGLEETLATLPAPPSTRVDQSRSNLDRARSCIEQRWGMTEPAVREQGGEATAPAAGLTLAAPAGSVGYVYAPLAIAFGFAADKLLGDMIGSVIRRLEENAEKTRSAEPAATPAATQ